MTTIIDIVTLLTIIYVLVDDWYKAEGHRLLRGKPGAKPVFSDSEVLTLMLAMDFIPFPSERQFLGFMRANYLNLLSSTNPNSPASLGLYVGVAHDQKLTQGE